MLVLYCGAQVAAKPRIVCYWANWVNMAPEEIDATLCTHIYYAFHVMDPQNNVIKDSKGWPQPDIYNKLLALKHKNPTLQVVVSVGGWGQPNEPYSKLVNTPALRKQWIANTIAYIQKYKFDGLDIDWEYPVCWTGNCTAGPASDRVNYGVFVKEIREAFNKLTPRLTISAAVVAGADIADKAYDYKAIGEALDYVNVMTYDLAHVTDGHTGHHSKFSVCVADVEDYVRKGVPKDKVLMGQPFYGHTYHLADRNKHGVGAPITGDGHVDGNYKSVCKLVKSQGWTKEQSDAGHDPIAYKDLEWVGYDDPYAAYDKSKWVRDNGYGGIIIWEISQDDYRKECCSLANPLLHALNYGLNNMKLLALVAIVLCSVPYFTTGEKLRVICYWANSLPGGMTPEQIDPTLCTHLHYAFHQIDDKNNVIIDEKGSAQPDTYTRLLALKKINPDMKLIVSVGGWARPDIKWSRLVNSAELRREFIRNTIPYLQKYKFDGLDLDWEYPVCWTGNCTAGPKSDKVNFGLFVKEIRAAFEKLTPRLTISAAVVAGTDIADISYDYKVLGEALDYVNIMTYDLAPVTWKHTAHHSPYALCIQNVNEWVDRGVPKAKCQLGVPFHARTFTLVNEAVHGNNAPTTGNGKKDYEAYRNPTVNVRLFAGAVLNYIVLFVQHVKRVVNVRTKGWVNVFRGMPVVTAGVHTPVGPIADHLRLGYGQQHLCAHQRSD
ncbi:unnamed protein product [Medioppia subpectinata]|uniref:GH18 domain-containing protein n=1 Tax=Medioppia subpectinata TaxID=1979941 RepID=A0A7R9KGC0_9ACAR|nr:unnamed protein product [Medioppia subpectinata]CAG2102749.1 unnamed protein product [Medioppia subpectinata]